MSWCPSLVAHLSPFTQSPLLSEYLTSLLPRRILATLSRELRIHNSIQLRCIFRFWSASFDSSNLQRFRHPSVVRTGSQPSVNHRNFVLAYVDICFVTWSFSLLLLLAFDDLKIREFHCLVLFVRLHLLIVHHDYKDVYHFTNRSRCADIVAHRHFSWYPSVCVAC